MSLFLQLQRDRKYFYTERDPALKDDVVKDLLSVVIGDIQQVSKDPTDKEVLAILKSNLKQVERFISDTNGGDANSLREKEILESYLPKKISKEKLKEFIDKLSKTVTMEKSSQGTVMKAVKKEFGNTADMKMASELFKEMLLGVSNKQ